MKVAPVSADLLIKLAIAAAVIGAGVYLLRKLGGAVDSVLDLPGVVADHVVEAAKSGGAAWQKQTAERPPTQQEFFGKYQGPLVNNDGMDFGALSG